MATCTLHLKMFPEHGRRTLPEESHLDKRVTAFHSCLWRNHQLNVGSVFVPFHIGTTNTVCVVLTENTSADPAYYSRVPCALLFFVFGLKHAFVELKIGLTVCCGFFQCDIYCTCRAAFRPNFFFFFVPVRLLATRPSK